MYKKCTYTKRECNFFHSLKKMKNFKLKNFHLIKILIKRIWIKKITRFEINKSKF